MRSNTLEQRRRRARRQKKQFGMPLSRAVWINGEIVCATLSRQGIYGEVENSKNFLRLPPVPLPELLLATTAISRLNKVTEERSSGPYTIHTTVADRGIAALFAIEHFYDDPVALLDACGFTIIDDD